MSKPQRQPSIQVTMLHDLYDRAQARAREEGLSMHEWVRKTISEALRPAGSERTDLAAFAGAAAQNIGTKGEPQ